MKKAYIIFAVIPALAFLLTCENVTYNFNSYIVAEFQNGAYPFSGYMGSTDANMASGELFADNNYGGCDQGSFGYLETTHGITRYLIQFDISSIPSGVILQKAFITLYAFEGGGTGTVSCHKKTAGWIAGSNCGTIGGMSWTSSNGGGEYDSESCSNEVSVEAISQKYITFSLDPSVVQGWIDDSTSNHGLLLSGDDETSQGYIWSYFSDYSAYQYRPKLTIYYTIE